MQAAQQVNANADVIGKGQALSMNIGAAKSLQQVLATNLGPKGTLKMLVSGAGQVKITKDGKQLLDEMQIQHPTAAIIARTATAQDDITGDGTTSIVLFTGELLKQAERIIGEGLHPRVIADGFEQARDRAIQFLDSFKIECKSPDREMLTQVARSSLRTKVYTELADHLTEIVVDAVQCIRRPGDENEFDLHMVEIMHMRHQSALDTRFINGIVMDHGTRHPNMAKRSENCHIFVLNVSLEYERSETNAGMFYKNAQEREKMVSAEQRFVADRCNKIIDFKNKVCQKGESFILINQKGIDALALDLLQKANIVGIRRAKRRNMERLSRSCGGYPVDALEDGVLVPECLGFAKLVYEHTLGDDVYTFVEGCREAKSCSILVKGPNDHTIRQIKDAVQDGLRAVKNVFEDKSIVYGAGAFEMAASLDLMKFKSQVEGRAKLGVQAFADALLIIPKTLAINSGLDAQTSIIDCLDEAASGPVGLDIDSGKPVPSGHFPIWDNAIVKRQFLHLGSLIAIKLLLVDEVMRAGRQMKKE
jgi:T-complex protein 1 subunit zeta